jgi:hypothetical protein
MHDALPDWLSALREDRALADALGIQWLDDEARRHLHASATQALETHAGGDAGWNERGLARLARCTPIALGPERKKRVMQATASTALFFDPERPAHVGLSMAASMSPLVWAEAPATADGLRALWARYFVDEAMAVAALPRRFRSVVNFGDLDRAGLEDGLGSGQPMLDDAVWYSAHADDPWAGMADVWGITLMAHLRDVRREHPGRLPSMSFRTLFSRSVVKVEQHPFGLWVVEIRYAPSPDAAGVRWVNEVFHAHFPEDVPADVIGSTMMQGGHTFAHDLDEAEADGTLENFGIAVRLALSPGEPTATAHLRGWIARFADDPVRLEFLTNAASRYRDDGALLAIATQTAGSPLADNILEHLRPKPAAVEDDTDDDDDELDGEDT